VAPSSRTGSTTPCAPPSSSPTSTIYYMFLRCSQQPAHTVGVAERRRRYFHVHTAPAADIYRVLTRQSAGRPPMWHPCVSAATSPGGLEPETQTSLSKRTHNPCHQKPLHRIVCHRIVLDTVARDLSTFSWCKILLSCVADAVEGARIVHFQASDANRVFTRGAASIYSRYPTPRYQRWKYNDSQRMEGCEGCPHRLGYDLASAEA
jgi:hypothetical protein